MSDSTPDATPDTAPEAIDDAQLPDDLVPGDDNPLAEGLAPGETVEGLLTDGKTAEEPESDGSQGGHDGAS